MLKRQWTVVAALAVMAAQTACYNTRVVSRAQSEGPSYRDRQWFTAGGLARLSRPAGQYCQNGISWTESKMSGTDLLIIVGLSVAGGIAGSLSCGNSSNSDLDAAARISCGTAGAALLPFLLSSRTVVYSCAAAPDHERPAYMPPPQNNMAPPPPPPEAAPAPEAAPEQ